MGKPVSKGWIDTVLSLYGLYEAHAEWAQKTFGSDAERGPIGPLKHLHKEVDEALADPTDKMEYVDCMFLVWDAARRAKVPLEDLIELGWRKLAILKTRTYAKPEKDEFTEHER